MSSNGKNREYGAELFTKRCRENSLKITPQRYAVYRELLMSKDHPHADVIHRRVKKLFPHISLDTVNRTLLTFYKIGITDVVAGSGEPKRFDADMTPHHHFRCLQCNDLIDIYDGAGKKLQVPEEMKRRFTVLKEKVYFEGFCSICTEK
jgi:Fur family peroxide stress response transcriptional regulator